MFSRMQQQQQREVPASIQRSKFLKTPRQSKQVKSSLLVLLLFLDWNKTIYLPAQHGSAQLLSIWIQVIQDNLPASNAKPTHTVSGIERLLHILSAKDNIHFSVHILYLLQGVWICWMFRK